MQIRGARIAVVPCTIALALLAGCGDDDKSSGAPAGTSAPQSAATSSAAPSSTAAPSAAPTTEAPPTATRPPAPGQVDPAQYRQQSGYYFQTPSGSFLCAILDQPISDNAQAGCQGPTNPAPAQYRDCWAKDKYAGALAVGAKAEPLCLNQGVFVGEPLDGGTRGGGRVLPYGAMLTVGSFTCDSTEAGVTCTNDTAGTGFQISRESNRTF
ncbi:hypothetical protein [Nocardia brasiliensis]|uniref:hypothetical protein n=1 Tax=Nocardia brasiliensis TaxID=37326 RepID=UPI00138E1121|nr:hypothetical protein [Nocardia brasiliensis]